MEIIILYLLTCFSSDQFASNGIFKKSDFKPNFIVTLKKDSKLLNELVKEWDTINSDPKLDVFIDQLSKQFLNKKTNLEGKLVIFSESKDTVDYLNNSTFVAPFARTHS